MAISSGNNDFFFRKRQRFAERRRYTRHTTAARKKEEAAHNIVQLQHAERCHASFSNGAKISQASSRQAGSICNQEETKVNITSYKLQLIIFVFCTFQDLNGLQTFQDPNTKAGAALRLV
jgi:hypothetical protein